MSNKQEYRDALAKEFLEALKQPEIEYYCPWYSFAAQRNGFTDRKYNGLNSLYLNLVAYKNNWTDSRWFTFTQLKKLNESRKPEEAYSVKGQHGMPVEFFTVYDVQEKKKISLIEYYKILGNASDEQLKDIQRRYRVHNEYTTVFNAHQIQNMELMKKDKLVLNNIDSKNIEDLAKNINVKLSHESIDRAFYRKSEDAIHLPFAEFFKSQNDYNYTALHELSHSTGHESRLNRDLSGTFGTEEYALEELIAEMSCSFYGFNLDKNSDPKILNNHKAYIQSWAKVIENDPKKFFDAVSQAQKAADFLEEHSGLNKEKELLNEFSKTIDNILNNPDSIKNISKKIIISQNTKGISFVNGDETLPLEIKASTINKILKESHADSIEVDVLKNISNYISNNCVLGIKDENKTSTSIILDLHDKNNNPILIAISLSTEDNNRNILINEIKSVYGRENMQMYLNNSKNSIIYMNKKSNQWLEAEQLIMPNPQANHSFGYSNNIPSENNDVKLPSAQEVEQAIENAGKKKIHLSEKDKLWTSNRKEPLDLKKYQDKANEHNKELKKNVAPLERKTNEKEI